jgi:hypothetical protein
VTGTPLRACAACGGSFLAYATRRDEPFFCPRCTDTRMEGFDPQRNDRVLHVDRQSGPFSQLVVIERDGEKVTVQVLGSPQRRFTLPLGALVPASGYGSR